MPIKPKNAPQILKIAISSGSAFCVARKAVRTAPCGAKAVNHKQQNASVINDVPDGCAAQRLQAFPLSSSTTSRTARGARSLEHLAYNESRTAWAGADDATFKTPAAQAPRRGPNQETQSAPSKGPTTSATWPAVARAEVVCESSSTRSSPAFMNRRGDALPRRWRHPRRAAAATASEATEKRRR